ncbi:unnamed protein product, partial [Meganyctiphanes norvegica]
MNVKGNGHNSNFKYQRGKMILSKQSRLWTTAQHGKAAKPSHCVALMVEKNWSEYPGHPLRSRDCSEVEHYPLCEQKPKQPESLPLNLEGNIPTTFDRLQKPTESSLLELEKNLTTKL